MRPLRLLVAPLLLAAFSSCDDATAPATTLEGTYGALSLGGNAFPIGVHDPLGATLEILADTLRFTVDGEFLEETVYRRTTDEGEDVFVFPSPGAYTRVGNALSLTYDEPLRGTQEARLDGSRLTVLHGEFSPDLYERVEP